MKKTEAQRGRKQLKVAQLVSEDRDLKQAAWPQSSSCHSIFVPSAPRLKDGWQGSRESAPPAGDGTSGQGMAPCLKGCATKTNREDAPSLREDSQSGKI